MQPSEAAVRAVNLRKMYGSGEAAVTALGGVDLEVAHGSFLAVMGPSGSGKSTLMQTMAGLDSLDAGEVWIEGTNITRLRDRQLTRMRRDRIGFIFQSFNLIPTLTAEQNILLPLKIARQKQDKDWVSLIVKELGIRDRLSHRPHELSGGQQQRVAIARAVMTQPAVVFADEPTGNLDSNSGTRILQLLRNMVSELGQTVIMVTHDPKVASYADEVLILADGKTRETIQEPTQRAVLEALSRLEPDDSGDEEHTS
ncbi:ABC transporter ATP-binding protein [Actinomyces sp. 2119]|uniref:ABC transporter ATP-binding protein n=1 Tax=Actinomyces sp. 2119 TaxID=2321393 RepID=UPI000E6CCE1E|nr:ABC transporter ATP-binding protein [Actinomyces sp. 2119]RJF42561.1 ABC transporter ATP-binding protein [Actinomyces sp. 2119]